MNMITSYHNGRTHVIEFDCDQDMEKIRPGVKLDGFYNRRVGVRTFLVRGYGLDLISRFRSAGAHFYVITIRDTYDSIDEWKPGRYMSEQIHFRSKLEEGHSSQASIGGTA